MSERRVQLPEAAEDFVMDGLDTSSAAVALFAARKLAQWLVANPQVPTDEQIDSIEFEPCSTARWAKQCITEFQRRFLFAPEEPERTISINGKSYRLLAEDWEQKSVTVGDWEGPLPSSEPEDPLADLVYEHPEVLKQSGVVGLLNHNDCVREAFKRGQQSMITKEKQP